MITQVDVVFDDVPEGLERVVDVCRPDEVQGHSSVLHRGRKRNAVSPTLASDLVVHSVGHVLGHDADCSQARVLEVRDVKGDALAQVAGVWPCCKDRFVNQMCDFCFEEQSGSNCRCKFGTETI